MRLSVIQLILEELQDFYDYDQEQSMADRYLQKHVAIDPAPKEQVDAELIGYVDKQYGRKLSEPIPVYKNPQALKGFGYDTRGVLVENGDLYLAKSWQAMHDDILDMLSKKNIVPYAQIYHYFNLLPEEFIAVQRAGSTNTFGQSSAYDEFPDYYDGMFEIANQRQPFQFKAYPPDPNLNETESPLDPNFMGSNIPDGYDANILYEKPMNIEEIIGDVINEFSGAEPKIRITLVEPDYRKNLNEPQKYHVNYQIEVNDRLVELEGTLSPFNNGRSIEYTFEPDYFTANEDEVYFEENWEDIEDQILSKFYQGGMS
jgi:hypothetical protein